MKRSCFCIFLSILLLFGSLAGCSGFGGSGLNGDTTATDDGFEPYYVMASRDGLVLHASADPTSPILGTANAGEMLHVLKLVTVDGIEWASTDRGWILAEYLLASSGQTEAAVDSNACASVVTAVSVIHPTADPDSMSVGQLTSGDRVTVTEVSYYGDIMMVRVPGGWVKATDLLFDGCTHSGTLNATVTVDSMNVRSGPSVEHAVVGKAVSGDVVTVKGFRNSEVNGKPWAVTPDGRWYFTEYLSFAHGIHFVPVSSPGQTDSNTGDTGNTPTQPGSQTQSGGSQQGVSSTALVGTWISSDIFTNAASAYLTYTWTFYNDGKFMYEKTICSLDYGGFYVQPGVEGKTGTYTYDGKALSLHYETEFDPNPNGPTSVNYTENHQASASANTITIDGQSWTKLDNYNASKPLVDYLRKQRPGQATDAIFTNWVNQRGAKLAISRNGTFEAVTENGQSYSGSFYVSGENIYFVIDNKLCDNSGTNYIHSAPFSVTDSSLSLGSDRYAPTTE